MRRPYGCASPVDKDGRFTGYTKPAGSLTPRIVAAASAGGHAFIIDVSRSLYVIHKSKIMQEFFLAGSSQPAGRKTIAQQFMAGYMGRKTM